MTTDAAPDIAIVIPIYKHSVLADEAIASALTLSGPRAPVVIAVDDGCPNPETRRALQGWALQAPDRFRHLHQPNRGLSAARNTGIRYALDRYPSLRAVFPLDADNLLAPHSLEVFETLLRDKPEADWFYPNFDMFGLQSNEHNGGRFSVAILAASNLCEAGSLIRRRVFDQGIWFDETFRDGYEDWDFWLSAASKGLQGAPIRQGFFRYRKRPQSMLAGAHNSDWVLRERLKRKHRWLYAHDHVAQAGADEMGRYVIFDTDPDATPWLCTDPTERTPVARDALLGDMIAARARPWQVWLPQVAVFARPGVMDTLLEHKLAHSALWRMHTSLSASGIASLRLVKDPEGRRDISVVWPREEPDLARPKNEGDRRLHKITREQFAFDQHRQADATRGADALMLRLDWLEHLTSLKNDTPEKYARRIARRLDGQRIPEVKVGLETTVPPPQGAAPVDTLREVVAALKSDPRAGDYAEGALAPWRSPAQVASAKDIEWIVRDHSVNTVPYPLRQVPGAPKIGFVMPIFQFGGVEKCVVALAEALRQRGVRCHLFAYGHSGMAATDWLMAPFETVHQINDAQLRDWRGPQYLGTNTAGTPREDLLNDMVAPLIGMDAVVMTGSAAVFHGLSGLRDKDVKVASWEHLVETGGYGRIYGTPYLGVAYEGGLDLILTCSNRLASWMHAQGVPSSKLLALPNGPGFPMDGADIDAALAKRAGRDRLGPLRVGFLGRLDGQKGADRYVEIAQACADLPIDFSITGSAVLRDAGLTIPPSITRYPAAYGIEELHEAFARIDILLMPSRDEGLPLTIMEAQRVGVVPIATDVGAVSEAIQDGLSGFLIRGSSVVEQMTGLLQRLVEDPALLRSVQSGLGGIDSRWDENADRLLAALDLAPSGPP